MMYAVDFPDGRVTTCCIAMLLLHQGSCLDQFIQKSSSAFFAVFSEPQFEGIDGEERLAERPLEET